MNVDNWATVLAIIGTGLNMYSLGAIKPKHKTATTGQRAITLLGILLVVFAAGLAIGAKIG